mgnify:CR=1 FL=1|jgi:tetratricopeptide (TPR) repeat protein|tara:strand:+ start:284 stop:1564 length:1281 start_codon:yes stop_codon:yes gene_type:complete
MKKYIVFAIALTLSFSAVAQKKELRTAKKELAKENYDKAEIALDAAEALLGTMAAKYKSKYYLYRSVFYSKSGGGPAVETVNSDLSGVKKSIEALQFVNAAADVEEAKRQKQRLRAYLVNKASSLLDKSEYETSSDYFEVAYNLSPSDTIYLYYAASTSVTAKQYDRSLDLYETLRALKFSGAEKKLFATNLKTNKKESFDNELLMKVSIKAGTHANPSEEFTKSKFPEIIKNIALIYMRNGDNDKALEAFTVARKQDPNNINLLLSEANLYYKMGDTNKFKELLEIAIVKDPNNPELQYNLGVISSDIGDFENSKEYYLRAIELKSDYTNAYINLSALILSQEQTILDEMNNLGSSKADDRKYDQLKEKRKQMYLEAIPYLESALISSPENFQAAKTLSNIHSAVGNTEKFKEFKAIADSLEEKQ